MFSCDSCKQCNPLFSFKYSFGKFNPLLFIRIASYIWIHYHLISYLVYFSFVSLLNFFASFKLFFPPHSIYALYYLSCYCTTAKGIFTFESMLITISAPTCSFPCDFLLGLLLWRSWLRIHLQCGRPGFNPWLGKIPCRRERLPTPVFWPGEFMDCIVHRVAESAMTEWLSLHLLLLVEQMDLRI